MTPQLQVTDRYRQLYPNARVGILMISQVTNPAHHPALESQKKLLEADLHRRFAGCDRAALRALPPLNAYHDYYKRFKKSYHVQLQLESILHRGKSIPTAAALVESMFMAELKTQILTAGHDLDLVQGPLRLDAALGDEQFVRINGQQQQLKAGDMYIADTQGVLSSVIYGPDQRTRITAATTRVVFTVYGPPGVPNHLVYQHLGDIETYVRLFSLQAQNTQLQLFPAADIPK